MRYVKRKIVPVLGLLIFGIGFVGCATVLKGTSQVVQINSTPASATVEILSGEGGNFSGTTPMSVQLKKGTHYTVSISLEGYNPVSRPIGKKFEMVSLCNLPYFCVGIGLPYMAIDYFTGAMYPLEPGMINVTLTPVTAQDGSETLYAVLTVMGEDGEVNTESIKMEPLLFD